MASNVDIAIRAKNEASGAIKQVSADLGQLDDVAGSVGGGLGNLGGMLAGGLIAGGLTVLADRAIAAAGAVYDLAKSAQSFDTLRASFDELAATAGESGDAMLSSLRNASAGMIADQDLILSANRAMMLGVAQNSQQMTQLLAVATARGKAMGMSATDAFNDLVTGLGRMSPLILDNLGIVTGGEKVFDDYAKSLGRTAASLSDAERKQALFNKVLSESRGMLGKGIEVNPFAKLDAQMANFKLQLGEIALPLASELASAISEGVGGISDIINQAMAQEDLSGAGKLGYAVGVGIKEAIIAGLGQGGPIEFRTLFGDDFSKSAYESAQGFIKARNEAAPEIFQATGAALGDSSALTDQIAQMERLRDLEAQIVTEFNAVMTDTQTLTRLIATGNEDLVQPVFDTRSGHLEELQRVRAEYASLIAVMKNIPGPIMAVNDSLWTGVTGWRNIAGGAAGAGQAMRDARGAASGLGAAVSGVAAAENSAGPAIANTTSAIIAQSSAATQAAGALRGFYLAQVSALGAAQAFSAFQTSERSLAGMEGYWESRGFSADQIAFERQSFMNNQQASLQQTLDALAKAQEPVRTQTKTPDYGIADITQSMRVASGAQENYQRSVAETAEEIDRGGRAAVKFGDTVAGSTSYGKQKTDELRGAFGELGTGVEDALGGAGGGGAAGAVDALATSLDDLRSKVSSVLSSALSPDIGFDPAGMLPREDDINENARRLAAIANEGIANQPWLEEFKATAPQAWSDIMAQVAAGVDAKTAAASIYRDFQQGLRPDLIDKDLVKQRVKAMIIGDQNMAALAEEIAQELATEMNIPLSQALAAAGGAMGVATGAAGEAAASANAGGTDMTAGGAAAGTTFVAGFLATADGTQLVAGIVLKLQTEMPKFLEAGKGAGTQWGSGFMTTVESGIATPLINLLVTLVTPGVMAQMAAKESQGAAP